MRKIINLILCFIFLSGLTIVFAIGGENTSDDNSVYFDAFDSLDFETSDESLITIVPDPENSENSSLKLAGGAIKTLSKEVALSIENGVVFEGKIRRSTVADDSNWIFQLQVAPKESTVANRILQLGKKSFLGSSTSNPIDYTFSNDTWVPFMLSISSNSSTADSIDISLSIDGGEVHTITETISGISEGIGTISFRTVNTAKIGDIYFDDFFIIEKRGFWSETLKKAESNETLGESEVDEMLAFCSSYSESQFMKNAFKTVKEEYVAQGGTIENNLISSSIENGQKIDATLSNIDFIFRYSLLKDYVITLDNLSEQNNPASTLSGNKLSVNIDVEAGNSYILTLSSLKDFSGSVMPDVVISFSTSSIPKINLQAGKSYRKGTTISWTETEGAEISLFATVDGDKSFALTQGEVLNTVGEYLVIIKVNAGGVEETAEISFTILPETAPEARDVRIEVLSGSPKKLQGKYEFFDAENDKKNPSDYRWLISKDDGRIYKPIDGEESDTLVLDEKYNNSYIIFEVTPHSDSIVDYDGKTVKSEPYITPSVPKASSIKYSGKPVLNENISITFDFYDPNGDKKDEEKTVITWYISDTGEENTFTPVSSGKDAFFKTGEEYIGKYLRASVIPASENEPNGAEEFFGEVLILPARPVAQNVKITGTNAIGSTLVGEYDFYDINKDEEALTTVMEWIDNSNNVIARGSNLYLSDNLSGKQIAFRVTVHSSAAPTEAEAPVTSAFVTVSKASSGNLSTGSSFGGSSSYSAPSSGTKKEKKKEEDIKKPEENKENALSGGFSDIKGHWAESYIKGLAEKKIINGVSETQFAPERKITRAEFITLLYRNKEASEKTEAEFPFADVTKDSWYYEYVLSAFSDGVISADAAFRPDDYLSREEAAKIIVLYTQLAEEGELNFIDSDSISEWAKEYVSKAVKGGIFKGNDKNEFLPEGEITRAEAATIIWRISGNEVQNENK